MAKRLVREAQFDLQSGQSLVVSVAMLGSGLDTVTIERDQRGRVQVRANNGPAGGRFEFEDRRGQDGCDFWVARANPHTSIADIIRSLFWSQFTYGELEKLRRDPQVQGRLTHAVRKLADRMEADAARQLNRMVKFRRFRKGATRSRSVR